MKLIHLMNLQTTIIKFQISGSIHKREALKFIAENMKAYYKNNSISCISNVKFQTK